MPEPVLHKKLPIIEVADSLMLDDLYADPRSTQYLLTRLGSTVAVVVPGEMDNLLARLLKLGHTPKVLDA